MSRSDQIRDLMRHVLESGVVDWVNDLSILNYVREKGFANGAVAERILILDALTRLIDEGLVRIGVPGKTGFDVWPMSGAEAAADVARVWDSLDRDLGMSDLFWLENTPRVTKLSPRGRPPTAVRSHRRVSLRADGPQLPSRRYGERFAHPCIRTEVATGGDSADFGRGSPNLYDEMTNYEAIVEYAVAEEPEFLEMLRDHLDAYEELLPILFLGEMGRWAGAQSNASGLAKANGLARRLEELFAGGDDDAKDVIATGFLENLPALDESPNLDRVLGPELRRAYRQIYG